MKTNQHKGGKRALKGVKFRACLGWCGRKFKTSKYVRVCPLCADRMNFAASSGMFDRVESHVRLQETL